MNSVVVKVGGKLMVEIQERVSGNLASIFDPWVHDLNSKVVVLIPGEVAATRCQHRKPRMKLGLLSGREMPAKAGEMIQRRKLGMVLVMMMNGPKMLQIIAVPTLFYVMRRSNLSNLTTGEGSA